MGFYIEITTGLVIVQNNFTNLKQGFTSHLCNRDTGKSQYIYISGLGTEYSLQ